MHAPNPAFHGPDAEKSQHRAADRAILVGVVVNLLLSIGKIIAGVVGHSAALVADGVHSASDLVSDGVVWLGMRIARQAPDEEHPYGHGRFETLATLFIALALLAVAIGIVVDAVDRVHLEATSTMLVPTDMALIAVILSIFTKEGLFHYTLRVGERLNQRALIANAWHHRSDAISSIAAMVGIVGAQMGWPLMDPIAAIVVAFILGKVAWGFLMEVYHEFVNAASAVDAAVQQKIQQLIDEHPDVRSAHLVKARRSGSDVQVDIHVVVNPMLSVSEGHQIAEQLRMTLTTEIQGVQDALVHVDPEDDTQHPIPITFPNRSRVKEVFEPHVNKMPEFALLESLMLHYTHAGLVVDLKLRGQQGISIEALEEASRLLCSTMSNQAPKALGCHIVDTRVHLILRNGHTGQTRH
uniref:Putative Cation diffusion facilitator family transporter n=1 Tax=Magnetococcus massalia (strain MO-1) TaxID=451514 RepID=A0A1S7LI41_MAGMO|nr:putative Cation diffusion facilitator family transporter [Candidatus Magnetococcus massalia]